MTTESEQWHAKSLLSSRGGCVEKQLLCLGSRLSQTRMTYVKLLPSPSLQLCTIWAQRFGLSTRPPCPTRGRSCRRCSIARPPTTVRKVPTLLSSLRNGSSLERLISSACEK